MSSFLFIHFFDSEDVLQEDFENDQWKKKSSQNIHKGSKCQEKAGKLSKAVCQKLLKNGIKTSQM